MKRKNSEVERRTAAALAAIKQSLNDGTGEFSVALFISHHLEEMDSKYWKKHVGTARPSPEQALDLLVLRSHWAEDDEDGLDIFDFTLPHEVTDYVITVRFDDDGEVESVDMES